MRSKEKVFIGAVLFYITCLLFPVVTGLLHIPVWMPSVFVSMVLLALYPRVLFRNKTFVWLVIYFIITFMFITFGRKIKLDIGVSNSYPQLIIEYAFLLPNVITCLVLLYIDNDKLMSILGKSTMFILVLSFLVLIPLLQIADLRIMAINSEGGGDLTSYSYINYSLLHTYVFLIPVVYQCLKRMKGFYKRLSMVLLVLLLYIVFKSNITTCLIIGVLSLTLSMVFSSNNKIKTSISILLLFAVVFVLYESGAFISILSSIRPLFEGTAVEFKIDDALYALSNGQTSGTIETRENLHQESWNAFAANILLGGGKCGGHSSILDRLATMGLVGFIPYFMIYYSIVKQWVVRFDSIGKKYYYLGVGSVVILLYSKGLFGQEGNLVFLVLLPILALLPERIIKKDNFQ